MAATHTRPALPAPKLTHTHRNKLGDGARSLRWYSNTDDTGLAGGDFYIQTQIPSQMLGRLGRI
uniref:Uncharacterized protein n=1 Tax=Arundo donax TaxID=35708 RepID=A0A0A9CIB5_ARUDO